MYGSSIRLAVNHQPESRVRENRMHGSEGGGAGVATDSSYPYPGYEYIRPYGTGIITSIIPGTEAPG